MIVDGTGSPYAFLMYIHTFSQSPVLFVAVFLSCSFFPYCLDTESGRCGGVPSVGERLEVLNRDLIRISTLGMKGMKGMRRERMAHLLFSVSGECRWYRMTEVLFDMPTDLFGVMIVILTFALLCFA